MTLEGIHSRSGKFDNETVTAAFAGFLSGGRGDRRRMLEKNI